MPASQPVDEASTKSISVRCMSGIHDNGIVRKWKRLFQGSGMICVNSLSMSPLALS